MTTLILNGQRADLSDATQIVTNHAAAYLQSLGERQTAYSEEIELPWTQANAQIIQQAHLVGSKSKTPYRQLPAYVVSDGIPTVAGIARIVRVVWGTSITVQLSGETADLWARLGDSTLQDLDLSDLDHLWTLDNVASGNLNGVGAGYLWPLADCGLLTHSEQLAFHYAHLFPAVYELEIFQRILNQAGYTVAGNTAPLQAVVPCVGQHLVYRDGYLDPYHLESTKDTDQTFTMATTPGIIAFPDGADTFTVPFLSDITLKARIRVRSTTSDPVIAFFVRVRWGNLSEDFEFDVRTPAGEVAEVEVERHLPGLLPGTVISLSYLSTFGPVGNSTEQVMAGSVVSYTVGPRTYPGNPVHLDANLPAIKQTDFLKDVAVRYGLLLSGDPLRKVLRVSSFTELGQAANGFLDWSDRLDLSQEPEVAYEFDGFGQKNLLAYTPREGERDFFGRLRQPQDPAHREQWALWEDTDLEATGYDGRGTLSIDNQHLEPAKSWYRSPFAASEMAASLSGRAQLLHLTRFKPKENRTYGLFNPDRTYNRENGEGKGDYVFHDLLWWRPAQNAVSSAPFRESVLWEQVSESDIFDSVASPPSLALVRPRSLPLIMAANGDSTDNAGIKSMLNELAFDGLDFAADLIPAHYPTIAGILDDVYAVRCLLRLRATDIATLDFSRPVWIAYFGAYFYLNAVEEYLHGSAESTWCELFRLRIGGLVAGEEFRVFDDTFGVEFN